MKKWFLSAVVALTATTVQAQQSYNVMGTAPADVKKVYVVTVGNRFTPVDSADVTAGKFALKGSQPENAVLGVGTIDFALMFINDGTPIEADLAAQTLKGSAQNVKLNGYDRELTVIDNEMGKIMSAVRSGAVSEAKMDSVANHYMSLAEKKEARELEIVRENLDNMIPVVFLPDLTHSLDYNQLKEFCNADRPYYNHRAMLPLIIQRDNLAKRQPGMMFTDMTIPDMDGKEHKLSEWLGKGQYVMIDFWASWCGPCRQEMPNVVANYEKYHAKGFEIIGISFDRSADPWKKAVEQMNMKWPQLSDLGHWQSAAAGVYGINSIPASILFDGSGKIIATNLRGEKLGAKLKELYGI